MQQGKKLTTVYRFSKCAVVLVPVYREALLKPDVLREEYDSITGENEDSDIAVDSIMPDECCG